MVATARIEHEGFSLRDLGHGVATGTRKVGTTTADLTKTTWDKIRKINSRIWANANFRAGLILTLAFIGGFCYGYFGTIALALLLIWLGMGETAAVIIGACLVLFSWFGIVSPAIFG